MSSTAMPAGPRSGASGGDRSGASGGDRSGASGGARSSTAARSLADGLRAMSDVGLAGLLRSRPDLGVPLPPDLTSLAGRAASRASVQRALDGLDSPTLQVLDVLAALPEPTTAAELTRRWGAPAGPVVERLRGLGLVWGGPRAVHLVRTARDLLGPHPAGLGPTVAEALDRRSPQRLAELVEDLGLPPTGDPQTALTRIAGHLSAPDTLHGLLATAPDGVRELLDRLVWGPPVGQVSRADRAVRVATASGPVDWLLAHGLLGATDPGHVVLPREVALGLRSGRVHRAPDVEPPELVAVARATRMVDQTAAGAAAEAVRLVDQLGQLWGAQPAPVLRAGGLGVRELRRAAAALEQDERDAARVIELAYAAGLIADDGELDPHWAPTPVYDAWRAGSTGQRWAELAQAWLVTTRCPALVGSRDPRDGVRTALGADLDRAPAPEIRRWVLDRLAEATEQAGEPVAVDVEALLARLDWTSPRRAGRGREELVRATLAEAAWLGVTGAGALARHAADLTGVAAAGVTVGPAADPAALTRIADLLDEALPDPIDHVLLQADLTAIAPGPLEPELDRMMALLADVESRGGATTYRFSAASLRRALDAGMTGADVLATLTRHARTDVPQPLAYLIADTARRHGRIRVGTAQAYLRADDESALAELLADRRTASLRLRRLAPTVLAAQAAPGTVLEVLRSIGLAPAAEGPDGDLVLRRATEHRTPPRARPRPIGGLPATPADGPLLQAVAALREADRARIERAEVAAREEAAIGRPPALAPMDPAGVLVVLREAAALRRSLWIGYVDSAGRADRRLVDPLSVEAGRISVFDRGARELRSLSVHRVVGVAPATTVEP